MTTQKEENPITTELVKNNVTDAVIQKLRTEFLPLKINGIDDKEGYDKVHRARIQCRDVRVLAEKVCKKGREDAVRIQKEWIAKEKETVGKIQEVELHLKKQEDAIDAEKEAIKIRAERLLKLPGRKEQMKGIEEFLGELTDEQIMKHDDAQWNQVIVIAQGAKLAKQQKIIDDENAKNLLVRTIERENELSATGAVLYSDGLSKVYRKGKTSVSEQMIRECIPEGWPKIIEVFRNAVVPEVKDNLHYKEGVTDRVRPIIEEKKTEASDEEKLLAYAAELERVSVPIIAADKGKQLLFEATEYLNKALNILRQ